MGDLMVEDSKRNCLFCDTKKKNEVKYGPMYRIADMTAHYYCVLLSNELQQRGADDEGMFGFLVNDIRNVLEKSKKKNCHYCGKGYANLKCWRKKCRLMYHYSCGINNGVLFQFFGEYKNYCPAHRHYQDIPESVLWDLKNNTTLCAICHSKIIFKKKGEKILWAPCCRKTWFHRHCIQKMALSAGYLFKCAICSNSDKFRTWMLKEGIYIPDKDASWELVPNAFEELLFRYNRCDANECRCPGGRNKDEEDTMWEIVLCRACGSQGIHIKCGGLKFMNPEWECELCERVMNQGSERTPDQKNKSKEEVNVAASSSIIEEKTSLTENHAMKKRKMSETADMNTSKRKKYDVVPTNSAFKMASFGSFDRNEITSSAGASSGEAARESEETVNEGSIDVVSDSPKECIEIVIDSSDSECSIIDVVDSPEREDDDDEDDEIQVVEQIIRQGKEKKKRDWQAEASNAFAFLYRTIGFTKPNSKERKKEKNHKDETRRTSASSIERCTDCKGCDGTRVKSGSWIVDDGSESADKTRKPRKKGKKSTSYSDNSLAGRKNRRLNTAGT